MRNLRILLIALPVLVVLGGCDPVHLLILENHTDDKIEVAYHPADRDRSVGDLTIDAVIVDGTPMSSVSVEPGETMEIGMVVARYIPEPRDINFEYLRIIAGQDTFELRGKRAIFLGVRKVRKLDWRLIIR